MINEPLPSVPNEIQSKIYMDLCLSNAMVVISQKKILRDVSVFLEELVSDCSLNVTDGVPLCPLYIGETASSLLNYIKTATV